jgi:putative transcriptional regulator
MTPHHPMVRHHPPMDLLISHAAGTLAVERRLVMATHLRACAACRREVALAEGAGGALLSDLPPTDMQPDALALTLARIDRPVALRPTPAAPARPDWIDVPSPVLEAAYRRRRWAAPGVWIAPVTGRAGGPRSYLLGVAAGMSVPLHTHRGEEMVCVLKGAYTDRGDIHHPGDFALNAAEVEHRPTVTEQDECVCLVAVDGALIARDWVGRLFQPLVGI